MYHKTNFLLYNILKFCCLLVPTLIAQYAHVSTVGIGSIHWLWNWNFISSIYPENNFAENNIFEILLPSGAYTCHSACTFEHLVLRVNSTALKLKFYFKHNLTINFFCKKSISNFASVWYLYKFLYITCTK
jgi:hypothetical protein